MKNPIKIFALLSVLLIYQCSKNNEPSGPPNILSFDNTENYTDTVFRVNDVIQLPDSSFIMAGGASIQNGKFQNLIMKFDKSGKKVWIRIKSQSDSPKGFSRIVAVSSGKLSAYRDVGFSYDPAPRIVDYDYNGNLVFQNFVNTSIIMHGLVYMKSKYYLSGEKNNVMAYQEVNPDGTSQWIRFFLNEPPSLSVSNVSDSALVAIGGGNTSRTGRFLYKINLQGDSLWTRPFGGYEVQGLSNGNFLAVTGSGSDIDFAMFDTDGHESWKNSFSDAGTSSYATGSYRNLDFQSQYYLFSLLKSDGLLYAYVYDGSGNRVNMIKITGVSGTSQVAITETMDNGFLVVKTNQSASTHDFELIKYSQVIP